ncbi:MAG: hypothetical protein ABR498_01465 [Candidatus Dormibacteria bacterium]
MADASQQEPAPPPPPPPPWGPPPVWYPPPYGWHPHVAMPQQLGSGRFRSMNVGELLDAVFSLYRRNFVLIAAISALVQVPFAALRYVAFQVSGFADLQGRLQDASNSLSTPGVAPSDSQLQQLFGIAGAVALVSLLLGLISALVVQPLAVAATTRAVSDRYLDRPASIATSYAAALRRLGALVVQSLILFFGAAVLILAAALVIALFAAVAGVIALPVALVLGIGALVLAVWVYVQTSLTAPAIVLEHLSGVRGLARSWRLVHAMFWRIFGILALVILITAIIGGILGLILGVAGTALDANGRFIVQQVASAVAAVFVSPIMYIALTLLYYDARIRKEAFDIEMLAQSL